MPMLSRMIPVLIMPFLAVAQVNVRGRAVDRKLVPVAAAEISLGGSNAQALTDATGRFVLQGAIGIHASGRAIENAPRLSMESLAGGRIRLTFLGLRSPARAELRRADGGLARSGSVGPGHAIWESTRAPGPMYVVLREAGDQRMWSLSAGAVGASAASGTAVAKATALPDTVFLTVRGVLARKLPITAYDVDVGDVVLPFTIGPGDSLFLEGYELFLRIKDYVKAAAAFQKVRADFPGGDNALAALAYLGKSQYWMGQYDLAKASLDQYLTAAPKGPDANDAYYYRGRALYQLAKYPEARLDFEKVLADFASAIEADGAAYYHARSFYQEGGYAQALLELQKFPAAYPASQYLDNAYLYWGRSEVHGPATDTARYRRAIPEFQKVLALFPASASAPAAQAELGISYYFLADYANARMELGKVETRYPAALEVADALYYLGRTDAQQTKYDSALVRFRRIVKQYPASVLVDNAHYQIGKTLYVTAKYPEAIASLKETLVLYPATSLGDNVELYLVRAYVKAKDCVAAKAELATMQKNYPASPYLASARTTATAACP